MFSHIFSYWKRDKGDKGDTGLKGDSVKEILEYPPFRSKVYNLSTICRSIYSSKRDIGKSIIVLNGTTGVIIVIPSNYSQKNAGRFC
jgi:hypothetical protein